MPNRPSHAETLPAIQKIKDRLKKNKTMQEIFAKYDVDISEIDTIPVCFAELDVSARTDHAIIYLNWEMYDGNLEEDDHYLVHEIGHYLQQTTGDGPTEGSTDDTYLDNEFEQEGFQIQTKYLSETRNDDAAEQYIEKVLDHHEVPEKEHVERKKELLDFAARRWVNKIKSFSRNFTKTAAPGDETWNTEEGKVFWGKQGAGVLLVCLEDNTALLLQRSERVEEPGTWGIAGGAIASDEDSQAGAIREATEELGSLPKLEALIDTVEFVQGKFKYDSHLYAVSLEEKKRWTPTIALNWENTNARWFPFDALPANLHFGVKHIKETFKEKGIDIFEDPKNEFDWIHSAFRKMFYAGRVSKSIADSIGAATGSADEESIKAALNEAGKWFVSNKDMDGLRQVNKMKKSLQRNGDQVDWRKPKHEKSQYDRFLYHGTDAGDALSILKNNTFVQGTIFSRVSFTSDIGIAFKFGDVVFVFDGKKLQRAGAKKMRYYSEDEYSRLWKKDYKSNNENSKNPKLNERSYGHEKEWAIPLPWKFDNDMLDHIIIVVSKSSPEGKAEQIKKALETVTDKPIKIQSDVSYGYSPSNSDTSKLQVADVKYAVFNYIAHPMNSFLDLGYKYIELEKLKFKKKYPKDPDDMIMYQVKNYSLYPYINTVFREKQELEATFRNPSRYDASRVLNVQKALARPLEEFRSSNDDSKIVADMTEFLAQIISGIDVVVKTMTEQYLNTEQDYENMLTGYNGSNDTPYLARFQEWLAANPSKIESLIKSDGEIYENNYSNPTAAALREMLSNISDPTMIPDSVWKRFPFRLVDSDNAYKMPTDRLRNIIVGNPGLDIFKGNPKQWIEDHRLGYEPKDSPRYNHWLRVIDILQPESVTPDIVEPKQE